MESSIPHSAEQGPPRHEDSPAVPARSWAVIDGDVLVLDDTHPQVYRLSGDTAREALTQLKTSQNRRRFLQSLAAGAVAGAAVIALPTAAAAASLAEPGDAPAGAEPDAEPSSVPDEQDGTLAITGTAAGDGEVTIDWTDSTN